ncbi:MAG: ABC transporter permease [Lewinellaceae bacterium]|nr:ABC transporter permease [Lewinellaceae bacterium]
MIGNYLKVAARNLLKYRLYSGINVLGLTLGLSLVLMILLYLQFEYSYDSWHAQKDRLYRVSILSHGEDAEGEETHVFTPPIGPDMQAEFPEVQAYTRFSTEQPAYLSYKEEALQVDEIHYADTSFFTLFNFQWLSGDAETALARPNTVVLTVPLARRLFGSEDPMGKLVFLDNQQQFEVTGLTAAPPANSHLQFEALLSFSTLYQDSERYMGWNGGNQYITYLLLAENIIPTQLEEKLPTFMWRHINEDLKPYGVQLEARLQPLPDIHLWHDPDSTALRTRLLAFGGIGLLILIIAGVNFVNLATARASWRAREVGVRKVLGASRGALIRQFMGEALLLVLIATGLAFLFTEAFAPVYGKLIGKTFVPSGIFDAQTALALIGVLVMVSLLAGWYPAFFVSRLQAVKALKGGATGKNKQGLRNALLVIQFAISAGLIACTLVIFQQLQYTLHKRLGFEQEGIVVLPLVGKEVQSKQAALKQELLSIQGVEGVAALSEVPGQGLTRNGYIPEGHKESLLFHAIDVDENFLDVFGLELARGRFFGRARPADEQAVLINESLARQLNWAEPIGKKIIRNGEHPVIGVAKDFHFASLHHSIGPLIITQQPWNGRYHRLALKARTGNWERTLSDIRSRWEAVLPQAPFDFQFLDASIAQQYENERRFQEAFLCFSILSILIALMGVLGLSALAIQQRTKEVGIRKVMGASAANIIALFSKGFLRMVGIAMGIGFPLAWYFMQRWLQGYAYSNGIDWWVFPLAGALTLLVAFLTVALRAIGVATKNPVEALRYE